MIDCERVAQALDEYDPDAHEASIVKAEGLRAQFLSLFPKDGWPTMKLDRYAWDRKITQKTSAAGWSL